MSASVERAWTSRESKSTWRLTGPLRFSSVAVVAPAHPISNRPISGNAAIKEDLPRCLIPLHAPGGLPQTLAQGRNKAWLAFACLLGVGLFLTALGIVFLIEATVAFQYLCSFVILAIGVRIAWRLRIVWRSIWNQRHWPMEEWRVNDKAAGSEEWRRWAPAPDDSSTVWS